MNDFLLCGSILFIVGISVMKYLSNNKVLIQVSERTKEVVKETIDEKRARIHKEITKSQWKTISRRLDCQYEENVGSTQWEPSAFKSDSNCSGIISLIISDGYGDNRKSIPIPLFRENRTKLEEMGFVITEDGCWAIYKEI